MPHVTKLSKTQEFMVQVVLLLAKKYNLRTSNKDCGLDLLVGDGFRLEQEMLEEMNVRSVIDIIKDKMSHDRKVLLVDAIDHHFETIQTTDPDEAFAALMADENKDLKQDLMESIARFFKKKMGLYVF